MEIIGSRFRDGTVFIPEVLLSARAMNAAVKLLKPKSPQENSAARGHILIGTVKGDFHDIGKNLVITMLRGVGHEVEDLGIDVPCERFVDCVREKRPQILGLSALLTTTMPEMKKIVDVLKASGLRNQVKVIVGGAPVNQHFASQIGADGYAQNAGQSVTLVKSLLNEKC
jgi:5-methyltetrahydrofolate--homocysteine methyltransferase